MRRAIYISRNAFLPASIAAVLTFLALLGIGKSRDQARSHDRESSVPENRVVLGSAMPPPPTQTKPPPLPVLGPWTPAPVEIVRLTREVTLRNSRGKEVKQFEVGKRLRVSKRDGEKITINYLGDEYTMPTASTEPWKPEASN